MHMVQIIKTLDRWIAQRHGRVGLPIMHFQKPHGNPGEREAVCVYLDAVDREYLPYGEALEREVEEARRWVRTGEGAVPSVRETPTAVHIEGAGSSLGTTGV